MIIPILLFILGLILLIKGGDWFVDGATGIAYRFHVPEIIIGATVVSIGTTLPEVLVSATGALNGQGSMAYGNAIGSIICNTSLIAAITMAIRPAAIDTKALKMPVVFFFVSAFLYAAAAYLLGEFPRWFGIFLLLIFVVYMIVTIRQGFKNPVLEAASSEQENTEMPTQGSFIKELVLLVIGAVIIAIGANLLVNNGTIIAQELGVPESVIALTFVALGTSLPELVTAITSLVKGHGALSVGNIIGANLFNLVLVSGVSVALSPFKVPEGNLLFGINSSFVLDMPLMFIVMALMTFPALLCKKLQRWQGIVLLCIYAAFCTLQFTL